MYSFWVEKKGRGGDTREGLLQESKGGPQGTGANQCHSQKLPLQAPADAEPLLHAVPPALASQSLSHMWCLQGSRFKVSKWKKQLEEEKRKEKIKTGFKGALGFYDFCKLLLEIENLLSFLQKLSFVTSGLLHKRNKGLGETTTICNKSNFLWTGVLDTVLEVLESTSETK